MARVLVTQQPLDFDSLLPAHTVPTVDGDAVAFGRNFLSVIVATASVTVTVQTPGVIDGDLAIAERIVVVAPGTTPTLIPLWSTNYRRPTTGVDPGRVYVDYSIPANVSRAVVSV